MTGRQLLEFLRNSNNLDEEVLIMCPAEVYEDRIRTLFSMSEDTINGKQVILLGAGMEV